MKPVLIQTIQFSINTLFSSIWLIDRTQTGATCPGPRGPGNDGNVVVLRIPQSSSITGASPSDCLVSYPGHSLRKSYPSVEMQSVYSTDPADWPKTLFLLDYGFIDFNFLNYQFLIGENKFFDHQWLQILENIQSHFFLLSTAGFQVSHQIGSNSISDTHFKGTFDRKH